MKHLIFLCITALFISACNNAEPEQIAAEPTPSSSLKTLPPAQVKDLGGDVENGFVVMHTYPQRSLKDAYREFLKSANDEVNYLESELPSADQILHKQQTEVEYKWKDPCHVEITLSFPGGISTLFLSDSAQQTQIRVLKSPD